LRAVLSPRIEIKCVVKKKILQKKISVYLFLFIGLAILAWLIYSIDWNILRTSFTMVGYDIFYVFFIAIIWITCNVACLNVLSAGKIPFLYLMYTQITGDAYNAITPFGGLGGVPVKIKHLTKYINFHEASETVIRDQLMHTLSGIMMTAILSIVAIFVLPLEDAYIIPFLITGIAFSVISVLFTLLIFSEKPGKLLEKLLKKVKMVSDYRSNPIETTTFLKALGFKMLGRVLSIVELWIIFLLLNFSPNFLDLITVMTMLTVSSSVMFIFPQGIGVHEASITGAFKILGYSAAMGLSFGLIRRARSLFWVLFGIVLHLVVVLIYRNKTDVTLSVSKDKSSLGTMKR